MQGQAFTHAVRIADDSIYLHDEERYKNPKEQCKQIYEFLGLDHVVPETSLCDVGCGTGEFLYLVHQRKPGMKLYGTDVSKVMLDQAKMVLPNTEFTHGSVDEPDALPKETYDFVTLCGVVGIFDDLTVSLNNCINAAKRGGKVLVFASFNPHPIDLITRYRRADLEGSPWELGWNVHSQYTAELIANANPKVRSIAWRDFNIPFAIAPKEDPMRCWTTRVGDIEHFHRNGANMLVDMKMMLIECN